MGRRPLLGRGRWTPNQTTARARTWTCETTTAFGARWRTHPLLVPPTPCGALACPLILCSLYYHHLVHVFQMMRDNQRLLKRPHTHKLSSLIFCHCIVTCPRRLWGTHAIFGPESDRSLPAVSVHARLVNFDGVAIIHPHNQHFRSVYIFPWAFQNEKHNDTDRSLWVRTGSVIAHRECLFV